MALSIIESRAINNRISTNLDNLNSGNLPILQSRSINKSIDEDMALLNWDKFDREQSNRHGLEPDGKDNEVKTAKGTKIVTGFMVIEASKLIVSHDEQGNANPDYPQEMQPRDRARDTSQAQIARIAKNLDPDMLGRTRVAYQGAPIIGKDGVVESGNGRAMAITLAYKLGKADEYRAWLLDIADMYGLNPDKIERMKRPVLVRVRKTDVDRAQFAIEANQSDMLAMTATEKAKSDAARLTDAIISKLSIEGDLTAASNRDFIMAFLQSLGDDETAGLLTTSGQPTKQLYDRAQAAVFAKAYNDDRLLELMADAEKPEIANIIKSLNQAAQPFITARNISEHATRATTQKIGDAIDASLDQQAVDAIVKATEMLKKAKDSGMPIEELIKQSDLFGDVDPVVAQMALFIKENNRSPARMGAAFVAMAEFVVKELESRQNASLFEDDAPIDMVDVLKAANAQLQKQYGEDVKAIGGTGGFIDMFTETRGQKADREAFLAREAANEDKQADPIVSTNHDKIVAEFDKKQREYSIIIENIINEKIKALGDGNYNLGFDKFMASVNESSSLMMVNEANAKNALSMYEGASKAADFLYNKYSEKVDKDLIFSLQSKFGTKVRDESNIGRKWYAELQDMAYQAKKTLPFDPVATANINAASISETLKKKAIKWLQENPESHELKGLSAKSLNIIIENIRSALFAEVMALSPLFKAVGDSNLSLKTPSGYLSMAVYKQKGYVTGYKVDFYGGNENYTNNLFDSTSTIAELSEWGFSLPFDLDVKAFVANVIKPVVDEFLSKQVINELIDNMPATNPVIEETTKPLATLSQAKSAMTYLKKFIGVRQLNAISTEMRGEEKQFFFDKMVDLESFIKKMPKTYDQDGLGDKAKAYLHYFKGNMDWHITERDMEDDQFQAFGMANLGHGGELGYISIDELIKNNIEIDLYWIPKTIRVIEGGKDDDGDPVIIDPEPVTPEPEPEIESSSAVKFSVGDIVYMSDITDENKRIPVNFRGYIDKEKSMVVWNGSQMAIETDRLFKEDLMPTPEPEIVTPEVAEPVPAIVSDPLKTDIDIAMDGNQYIAYHYSNQKFDIFDEKKSDGFWFTSITPTDTAMLAEIGASGSKYCAKCLLMISNELVNGDNYNVDEQLNNGEYDGIINKYDGFVDYAVNDNKQIKILNWIEMSEEENKSRSNPIIEAQGDQLKGAFEIELNGLMLEPDALVYLDKLEQIAVRVEAAGLSQVLDVKLNEVADVLTELLAVAETSNSLTQSDKKDTLSSTSQSEAANVEGGKMSNNLSDLKMDDDGNFGDINEAIDKLSDDSLMMKNKNSFTLEQRQGMVTANLVKDAKEIAEDDYYDDETRAKAQAIVDRLNPKEPPKEIKVSKKQQEWIAKGGKSWENTEKTVSRVYVKSNMFDNAAKLAAEYGRGELPEKHKTFIDKSGVVNTDNAIIAYVARENGYKVKR